MADEADTQKTNNEAAAEAQVNPLELQLRNEIEANGEKIKVIKFREPTIADIESAGNPVIMDFVGLDRPQVRFDERKMTDMIARLAAIPPSSVRKLHPKDWTNAAYMLWGFFAPDL